VKGLRGSCGNSWWSWLVARLYRASLCRSLAGDGFAKATDGVEKVPDGLVAPTGAAIPRQGD
jgi:hypothetical protein